MSDIDFLKQAAIAAMQAMIQARAVTEASQDGEGDTRDGDLFSNTFYCGVLSEVGLGKEEGGKYTWGELVAEEAFEIAECMVEQLKKRGHA